MSLFTASTWLVIASISYSFYSQEQAKKAQKKAKEEAQILNKLKNTLKTKEKKETSEPETTFVDGSGEKIKIGES